MTEANIQTKNRRNAIGFSVTASLIIILFLTYINFSVGGHFPWFIFPTYAVLWWPIGVIFSRRNSAKMLSLVGSFLTIALLFLTNYLTSWSYPWFLFPSAAILWWPLGVFFGSKNYKLFSLISSVLLIAFFVAANLLITPSVLWCHYPVFALIWWPLSAYFADSRQMKLYSVLGALIVIVFLTFDNLAKSPNCPWVLFTLYPVLMWPAAMFLKKRLGRLDVTLIASFIGILYYTALNVLVFKGFPWAIYPIYAILWWPLAIAFAKRGKALTFSMAGSLLTAALFVTTNLITSPKTIWAVYPIFAIAWWPLAVYFFVFRRRQI
jgi:hypothetical protein